MVEGSYRHSSQAFREINLVIERFEALFNQRLGGIEKVRVE
jgi:hypothetical protein